MLEKRSKVELVYRIQYKLQTHGFTMEMPDVAELLKYVDDPRPIKVHIEDGDTTQRATAAVRAGDETIFTVEYCWDMNIFTSGQMHIYRTIRNHIKQVLRVDEKYHELEDRVEDIIAELNENYEMELMAENPTWLQVDGVVDIVVHDNCIVLHAADIDNEEDSVIALLPTFFYREEVTLP